VLPDYFAHACLLAEQQGTPHLHTRPAAYQVFPYTSKTHKNTYNFNNEPMDQEHAEETCKCQGGHLVSYSSAPEQAEVEKYFVDMVSWPGCLWPRSSSRVVNDTACVRASHCHHLPALTDRHRRASCSPATRTSTGWEPLLLHGPTSSGWWAQRPASNTRLQLDCCLPHTPWLPRYLCSPACWAAANAIP
jgi:hypothetical protein